MRTFRIGTRGSALALKQADMVRSALLAAVPEMKTDVIVIRTKGDLLTDAPLDAIGGKGVFVKDIENQLLSDKIDIAVHSAKDMQAVLPDGLTIGAFLKREDPRDMLFSSGGFDMDTLPKGSSIGTSSMRRRCQLRILRPDLEIMDIRGNVPTRLKKLGNDFDALILAAAGVIRLGLPMGVAIDHQKMTPSPCQGIIAIECRSDDSDALGFLNALDHYETRLCALTERSFLATLGQDCNLPAGALAFVNGKDISITGMLGSPEEATMAKATLTGLSIEVGCLLAKDLMKKIHKEGSI